jgi:hypothetical protein
LRAADALEGDITLPSTAAAGDGSGEQEFNTLDEPVKDTIVRLLA